jgi:hypothetical protein
MSRKAGAILGTLYVQPKTSKLEDKITHWPWTCKGFLKFANILTILGLDSLHWLPASSHCRVGHNRVTADGVGAKRHQILKMTDYSMSTSPESPSAIC